MSFLRSRINIREVPPEFSGKPEHFLARLMRCRFPTRIYIHDTFDIARKYMEKRGEVKINEEPPLPLALFLSLRGRYLTLFVRGVP